MMSFILRLSAKKLALVALAVWICSLAMTAFVLYSEESRILGISVLLFGWLSPIILNFAWFANIPFLYAICVLLFTKKLPIRAAVFSALLALDTFRFEGLLTGGGSLDPIYGYGWGPVFWFMSIYLMLASVGIRRREINALTQKESRELLYPIGITLVFVTVCTATYFSWHDRKIANTAELKRLANVAFKFGKACGSPEPQIANPIRYLSGPVEIVLAEKLQHACYPFAQIQTLLQWGIPTVRVDGDDYSYESTAHYGLFSSVPAVGLPAAALYVSESSPGNIHAKLVEFSTNRTVFEQTWVREDLPGEIDRYCPDFNSFPSLDEQPRKVLMQGLGLHGDKFNAKTITPEEGECKNVEGALIKQGKGGITTAMKAEQWRKLHPEKNDSATPIEIFNTNCPSNIGWSERRNNFCLNTGIPFMVNKKAYYLPYIKNHNLICAGNYAYIYSGSAERGKGHLGFQERDLRNFRKVKSVSVTFAVPEHFPRYATLKLQSIKKVGENIILEIVNDNSGDVLLVQARNP